jgi:hypothetical protein
MIIIIGKDGQRRHEPDGYVLQDGESALIPRYVMDHGSSGHTQSIAKRYAWDGSTAVQLRRPGWRPKTLLQNGATTVKRCAARGTCQLDRKSPRDGGLRDLQISRTNMLIGIRLEWPSARNSHRLGSSAPCQDTRTGCRR